MANFVFIACSLDGYIAKPDGDLGWLVEVPNETGSDYGFSAFMKNVDAVVMGRATFDAVAEFSEWPYVKPVFVLSHSLESIPRARKGKAELMRGDPAGITAELNGRGFRNLYVDGGKTIRSFLEADLIDEMIVTWVSKVIGGGFTLFGAIGVERVFEIRKAEILNDFFVQCHYVRDRKSG